MTSLLHCSRCGKVPAATTPAREGGTHFIDRTRVSGIGQKPFTRAVTCGRWVAGPPQPRAPEVSRTEAPEVARLEMMARALDAAPAVPFVRSCAAAGHFFVGADPCVFCGALSPSDPPTTYANGGAR